MVTLTGFIINHSYTHSGFRNRRSFMVNEPIETSSYATSFISLSHAHEKAVSPSLSMCSGLDFPVLISSNATSFILDQHAKIRAVLPKLQTCSGFACPVLISSYATSFIPRSHAYMRVVHF